MPLRIKLDPSGAPLIALPCVLALLDIAATLLGQPPGYWQGDRSAVLDANPLVRMALGYSPWLSVPAATLRPARS